MAGPLTGLGQTQVPLSTPYQPGNAQQPIRQDNSGKQTDQVRPQGAPTNQTQKSETQNAQPEKFVLAEGSTQESGDTRRGSLVNLSV